MEISMDEYNKIEANIDSLTSEERFIETHKNLVGKGSKCSNYEIEDCGVEYIKELFSRDWGRTIVYHYSQGAIKFIHSKYLSDYFKNSIKKLLSTEELSETVLNALNSDTLLNDMSEEELTEIYSAIKEYYNKPFKKPENVANYFKSLLYKLDGKGVVEFIKNNTNNTDLAAHILKTSGLNDRASYYSGRGVNYSDLNEKNLVAIFNKLLKLNVEYAINFVEMVRNMETLGATEFINSFMNFAHNSFKVASLDIEESNVSLDGVHGISRDMVGFASIFSAMSKKDENYQISASQQMKNSFMHDINSTLQKISPDNQSLSHNGYTRKISD